MKSLAAYNQKRHFKRTPEPGGKSGRSTKGKLSFVVQRHDASHLHYDFRLEMSGVLKSWAVPKGPSMNPGDKRLAVMVEDHPMDYGKFEGVIPEGNYGAGSVEIWDKGSYEPEVESRNPHKQLEKDLETGSIKFKLHGGKLKGSFALVRMKSGKGNNWLLIKHKDEYATTKKYDPDKDNGATSVKAKGKEEAVLKPRGESVRNGRQEKLTHYIKPMMAQLHDKPFDDDNWIYEIKWDGYRAVAEIKNGTVRLYSRNGLSFEKLYPEVVKGLSSIKSDVILDGEIVAFDEHDKPSFQKLQQRGDNPGAPLMFYVFDCLAYDGEDITDKPLLERKKIAKKVVAKKKFVHYADHVEGKGVKFFEQIVARDMEGMIAKRADSPYQPGKRGNDWLKVKHHNTQEAVIAGFTAPRGSRSHFGALLLGVKEGKKLKYIGHTGTGFTESTLKELHTKMKSLVTKQSPFDGKVPVNGTVTWVKPELVAEVKFAEITQGGILRQPVFLGLRIDKAAKDVDHMDVAVKVMKIPKGKRASREAVARTATKTDAKTKSVDHHPADQDVKVGSHKLHLTNLGKLYWPDEKITKGQLIEYYNKIHQYILPYLKDRPQSLKRNPNGIADRGFFHKDAGDQAPAWVKSKSIYSESTDREVDYIICNDEATLMYLNNLGCIELNPWNSTTKHLDKPDYLIMDIDPSEKNTFEDVIEVTLAVKEVLDRAGAEGYCKTSGASGMHIYVPLHAQYTYDQIRLFAELIAIMTEQSLPELTTTERSLNKRKGRIYLDHLQNRRGQTLASVYSVRPVPEATVSTPLLWKEVKNGLSPNDFTMKTVQQRLSKKGDLFTAVLTEKTDVRKCIARLGG